MAIGTSVSSVQFSRVQLFETPCQASLSINNSWSLPKLMSIEVVMPSNHLIPCHPSLLLLQSFQASGSFQMRCFFISDGQSIGVSASASVLPMNTLSFSISPSNEHPGLISFTMDWLDLLAVQGTLKSLLHTTVQKHQLFCAQLSL